MIKRLIVSLVNGYREFVTAHPVFSWIALPVLTLACLAALYLLWQQVPTLINMPCFRGGCAG